MDYIGNKCPVCDKYFHADDDIVVCPECGTPHHRECYEQLGHCANEALHSRGYDYNQENENKTKDIKICPKCGKQNEADCFFCKYCGTSLTENSTQNYDNTQQQQQYGSPFSAGQGGTPFNAAFLDPLAGVPGDTDLGDGVTAGEAAKYVKNNTPYFIRVFSNIKNFNRSKFNFAAALFTGGYMLYRKMYKLGAIFAALQLALMVLQFYLESICGIFNGSVSLASTDIFSGYSNILSSASEQDINLFFLIETIDILLLIFRIVIGLCFNRMYFTHCKKQIVKIKNDVTDGENPETVLQTKGGVNTPLAISLLITAMIVTYLPRLLGGVF